MEDQYAMADLRQYTSSRPLFPVAIPQPLPDLLSSHRGLNHPANPYEMLMFRPDSTTSVTTPNNNGGASSSAAAGGCFSGFESGINGGGGDGGTGRWPRQETLTLLEIRSRLDPKFKEANQKGPLWDEVSRIMSEEHGYQRSGKKCREKFENLYKYYKKTKEGKAGRQDGKHYRFFRQLEALYGENSNNNNSASNSEAHLMGGNFHYNYPNNKNASLASNHEAFQCPKFSDTSLSLSNYSDADTSSSDNSDDLNDGIDDNDSKNKKRRGKRGWKIKIKDFIDDHMKKLMDKQEAWMEKMMRTIENKEQERMLREEEWRKQDAARIEREHKFWASERAWIEARDSALMDALHKITGKELPLDEIVVGPEIRSLSENHNEDRGETMTNSVKGDIWPESEIGKLIQLRTSLEVKFQQRGNISEDMHLWEEIANKMACFGHDRSGVMCKEKWDTSVNNYLLKCSKKRKENTSKSCNYNYQTSHHHDPISNHQGGSGGVYCDANEQGIHDHNTIIRLNVDHGNSSPNNNNSASANAVNDSCFRYFMGDAYGRIMD